MRKSIKFSLCMLGTLIVLAAVGWGFISILKYYGLMFRAWVGITFFIIMVLLSFALSGGIVFILVKSYSKPQEQRKKRIAQKISSAFGIIVVLLGTGVFGILVLFGTALGYNPEHVVEKYGQKMVAYDKSFLDLHVDYYEYINFIVCGNKVIGNEGPKNNFWFYDFQGNLIAKSEEKQNDEADKEPAPSIFPPDKMQCTFSAYDAKASCVMSYSTDGENWKEINTGYHYQFFFRNTGYLVFSYDWSMQHEVAAIYKSVDGGNNWTFVSDAPSDKLLQNTVFFDEDTGIFEYGTAGTDSYDLYVTTDGAKTLRKIDLPTELQGRIDAIKESIKEME